MVQESRQDSTGSAIAFLLFGVLGGLGLDLCAKGLLATYSLEEFVFLRSLIGLAIFVLLGRQFGGVRSLITSKWPWHLLRTFLATGASPALLAPFEYTALIGGAIAGYLIWDEVPDRWVALGATVIIASGLFDVYREIGGTISSRYLRAGSVEATAESQGPALTGSALERFNRRLRQ